MRNYREEWAEGEIEASALLDAIDELRAALEKIADWYGAYGPFPEKNEMWRAMAVVTAREAVPQKEKVNEQ